MIFLAPGLYLDRVGLDDLVSTQFHQFLFILRQEMTWSVELTKTALL